MSNASQLIAEQYRNGQTNARVWADLLVNPRSYGAKGDGTTDDTAAVQSAINVAKQTGGRVFFPEGTYKITSGLMIDSTVTLMGAFGKTILDFSSMASGTAITVGNGSQLLGVIIQGFKLVGNTNIDALKFNNSGLISTPVVDSSFADLRIEGFNVGLTTVYCWDLHFTNIRFQNCTKCMVLNSQSNAIEFMRCSFVSTTRLVEMINCEGINFTTCEFANLTGSNYGLTLFQSWISIINPYIELVPKFIQIGSLTETVPSSCTIKGGIVSGRINVIKDKSVISIDGSRANYSSFVLNAGLDDGGAVTLRKSTANFIASTQPKWITAWYGNTPSPFPDAFGGGLTKRQLRDCFEFNHAFANQGIKLSTTLTVDTQYTLVMAVQKTSGIVVNLTAGASNGLTNYISAYDGAFEVVYIPFVATTATLNLMWGSGSVYARYIGLVQGVFFPDVDIKSPVTLFASAVPTSGTWQVGDYVKNSAPAVGASKGWYCTVSGTPGTWVSEGNL